MSFNELSVLKKSKTIPKVGDIFVIEPKKNQYYYGKVIKTNLISKDSFINGMNLIYIYNKYSNEIVLPEHKALHLNELLIPPMIVNFQPWIKGYFMTIGNEEVQYEEEIIDYGFLDITKNRFLDISGELMLKEPKYWTYYGLGSYGLVGKEIQKAIKK